MSLLETIHIQGIRSFNPDVPQVLNFLKPVTLILGQNGTGKTTIIECLKYATTGVLPIGSKTGGSFIHDPKIAGETEVKAKVSLKITNLKGDIMTVTRSMKALQKDKNKQVSMQTLDSSIQRPDSSGNMVSISSKCGDIDAEMANSLGVSKAVLENVIFCHQEDSNWPLTEGKNVKERFDDLFASARYVKSLETIRKIKIEQEAEVKNYKEMIKYLKKDLDESNEKYSEKRILENQIETISEKIDSAQEKLVPIEVSIEQYNSQYSKLCEMKRQKDSLEKDKISTETRIRELEQNISEQMHYSAVDLAQMINNADLNLLTWKQSIVEKESKISLLESEIRNCRMENSYLFQEKGGLDSKIASTQKQHKQFNENIKQLVNEVNLPYDEEGPSLMITNLESELKILNCNFEKEKKTFNERLILIEKNLESQKSKKLTLENEIAINERTLNQKETALNKLDEKLKAIGHNSTKLNAINEKLDNLKSELNVIKSEFDSKSSSEKLEKLSDLINNLENQLISVDLQINKYQIEEKTYNQISTLQQNRSEKLSSTKRIRNRHNDSLVTIFENNIPENNLKRILDQKLTEFRNKSNESQKLQMSLQTKLAGLEVEMKQLKDKICENQKLIEKFDEDVYEICGNDNLESFLKEKRELKTNSEEKLLTLQSNVSLYAKFKDMLIKNKSDCPLCHREFHHDSEVDDLIDEISEKCNKVPTELKNMTEEISNSNEIITKLIKLESQSEKIKYLKDIINIDLERKLQLRKSEICELQKSITKLAKEKELNSSNENLASSILGDVANMDKYNDEIQNIDKNIKILNEQLTLSHENFKEEFETLNLNKKSIQSDLLQNKNELLKQRKSYEFSVNKKSELESQINNLTSESLMIQKGLQEWSSFQIQKDSTVNEIKLLYSQLQLARDNLVPINKELEEIKITQTANLQEKNSYENSVNRKISKFTNQIQTIKGTWIEIEKAKSEKFDKQLKDIENKIAKTNSKIQQNLHHQEELKSNIEEINSKISNHKIQMREYQDTLQIRHHSETISQLDNSIRKLNEQFSDIDLSKTDTEVKNFEKERRKLKDQIETLETEKVHTSAKLGCIDKDMQRFTETNKNYLEMMYKIKVTELAISDLEKYYKALDKAIMSYHQTKMAEINKILKELWRNTYSGKDIDYLEICSDEDTSGISSKKRTYNYRVVMVKTKGGVRLDMRGRCSAGQKVLACLLIRLALAEVFCLNCGVLSLDEPTTNLDQENIENLAYALVEIIKTRSQQKNFQLIVITHDEDFVDLLSRSDYVDNFYKIRSNPSGHSVIEKAGFYSRN